MPQAATNVTQLAEKIAAAVPRFDPTGRRVAVSLYRELAKGEPVSVARLATLLNLRPEAVSSALSACAVFYDNGGAVTGFGGLTFAEMPPHHLRVDGQTLYAWCAWDSLCIPGILGKTADVTSRDPVTEATIGRLGARAAIEPKTLRYYDRVGLVRPAARPIRRRGGRQG